MKKKNILIAGVASLVVIAATTYFIVRKRKKGHRELPPAEAPQLNITNPGDQSDFPAGPPVAPDLG